MTQPSKGIGLVVKIDALQEKVARLLHGFQNVPPIEQARMIKRICQMIEREYMRKPDYEKLAQEYLESKEFELWHGHIGDRKELFKMGILGFIKFLGIEKEKP